MPINQCRAPPRILWSDGAQPGQLVVRDPLHRPRRACWRVLTAVFERDGIDIAWAKVTTLGSSVDDVFCIVAPADGHRREWRGLRPRSNVDLLSVCLRRRRQAAASCEKRRLVSR